MKAGMVFAEVSFSRQMSTDICKAPRREKLALTEECCTALPLYVLYKLQAVVGLLSDFSYYYYYLVF